MPPTADPFVSAREKLKRADEHLADFQVLRERFKDASRDLIGHKKDLQTGYGHYYATRKPIVPPDFALLAGDVLQYLRSALDHVAYALCVAGPGGARAITDRDMKAIQFPICFGDATDYRALNARRVIVSLAKVGVESALDSIEPYKRGAGDLLCQLGRLNNIDKHRLLFTISLYTPSFYATALVKQAMPPEMAERFSFYTYQFFIAPADAHVLEAGDVFFIDQTSGEPNKDMAFAFPIAINEPEVLPLQPLVEVLKKMTDFVSGIIPAFERFV